MFRKLLLLFLVLMAGGLGFLVAIKQNPPFTSLSKEKMYQTIVSQRDLAIQKAIERGDYQCCITPPCTMCYMEANQWNNFQAGTCACDDLIAQAKEACPQCKRGICEESKEGTCKID